MISNHEGIRVHVLRLVGYPLKQTGFMKLFELKLRLVLFVHRADIHFGSRRNQGAHHQSRTVAQWMHAEELMRGTMLHLHQTLQFSFRKNHTPELWHTIF